MVADSTQMIQKQNPWIPAVKVQIPPQNSLHIQREIVTELQAIWEHRLTLIQAPAGFGKTTLLAQWAQLQQDQIAWLSLDANDNIPLNFLTSVYYALNLTVPTKYLNTTALQQLLLEKAFQPEQPLVLILDDYHLITAPETQSLVKDWLRYIPYQMHIVLSSRKQPLTLPLEQLQAKGQLLTQTSEDLRMKTNEVSSFFKQRQLDLSPVELAQIYQQSDGWVMSLHLLVLRLKRKESVLTPELLTNSLHDLSDFILQELFNSLTTDQQAFLYATAILDNLNPDLCQELSHQAALPMFKTLWQHGLPFSRFHPDSNQYAYHPLLREWLLKQLKQNQTDTENKLRIQSAEWHQRHHQYEQALNQAIQAQSWFLVSQILTAQIPIWLAEAQLYRVLHWLEQVPPDVLQFDLLLYCYYVHLQFFLNQKLCNEPERLAESKLVSSESYISAYVLTLQAATRVYAREPDSEHYLQSALNHPETDIHLRILTHLSWGHYHCTVTQKRQKALTHLQSAIDLSKNHHYYCHYIGLVNLMAQVYTLSGDLLKAHQTLQYLLFWLQDREWIYHPHLKTTYALLAHISLFWHDKTALDGYLQHSLNLIALDPSPRSCVYSMRMILMSHLASGNLSQASTSLEKWQKQINDFMAETTEPIELHHVEIILVYRTYLDFLKGHLNQAKSGFQHLDNHLGKLCTAWQIWPFRSVSRDLLYFLTHWYISQNQINKALNTITQQLIRFSQITTIDPEVYLSSYQWQQYGIVSVSYWVYSQFWALKALLLFQTKKKSIAIKIMCSLLQESEQQGILHIFHLPSSLDRMSFYPLLKQAISALNQQKKPLQESYLQFLGILQGKSATFFIQELDFTDKEIQILQLMQENLSNQQIAQRLFISINTLKTYIRLLYRKLNVNNRKQALQKAAESTLK